MYTPAGDHQYELDGRMVRVSTPTGGIGYGGYRTTPGGNDPQCACQGLGGCNCRKLAISTNGLGEETLGQAAGNWAHGAVDLVTWGFFALVLGKYLLTPKEPRRKARR